jgi:Ca2+-binding EF-hand superfamily protein
MGGGQFDPNAIFNMMSGGKDVIILSQVDPGVARRLQRTVDALGITNGQITREQYNQYLQQRMAQWGGGRGMTPGAPAAPGGAPQVPGAPGGPQADPTERWAENAFRRADLNGDGLLNYDEMDESLRAERDKWDTNKDGFIDLNEFKAYFKQRIADRFGQAGPGGPGGQGGMPFIPGQDQTPMPEEEEKKPVVYRAGKLPKELPAWFAQLDTDKDGQIGLYEWRAAGRPIGDFMAMDRNQDGFLTVEEVLRYEKQRQELVAKQMRDSGQANPMLALANGNGGNPAFGGRGFGAGMPGGFGQQPGGFGQQPGGFGQRPGGFGGGDPRQGGSGRRMRGFGGGRGGNNGGGFPGR